MNAQISGHWYCSFCNDVVNLHKPVGRWDSKRGVACPVCRNNSADWVSDTCTCGGYCPACAKPKPVAIERGHELFNQMRKAIQ